MCVDTFGWRGGSPTSWGVHCCSENHGLRRGWHAVRCGAWQRGVIPLQVFKFLHTDQKGAGQSLVSAGDLFTPDGEVSTGSKQNEPTAPPVPPPTARPSDTPTKLPTVRPTDAPRHPQTHLPTRVPTNTPTDPPVDFHGASPGAAGAQPSPPARKPTRARRSAPVYTCRWAPPAAARCREECAQRPRRRGRDVALHQRPESRQDGARSRRLVFACVRAWCACACVCVCVCVCVCL